MEPQAGPTRAGDHSDRPDETDWRSYLADVGSWAAPIGFLALIPERLSQADMIARTTL